MTRAQSAMIATLLLGLTNIYATGGVGNAVSAYLAGHPGGRPLNAYEISYGRGALVVDVAPGPGAHTSSVADCPAGWFCFYEHTGYGYPRGRLSSCGWQDLATWGWQDRIASAYDSQSSGSVSFINHTPGASHATDQTIFSISVLHRGIPDVRPYRDMADYVYRYCP
jgi:hypothetical protein